MDREELEAMGTMGLLQIADDEGIDREGLHTREDLIAVLLGEEPQPQPEPAKTQPKPAEVPVAETAPEPEPEPKRYEADDEGNLTVDGAAEMLIDEHVAGSGIQFSSNYRRAIRVALVRLMSYEIQRVGSLTAKPDDFAIVSERRHNGRIFAITKISLPDADECALVVAGGEKGQNAQPTLRYARMKKRFSNLQRG